MAEKAFEPVGLMGPQIFGLPVDRDTLFSNHKKIYRKRIEKRQRKLIVKLSFLKPFLKTGEKILLVSTGYSPISSLAQYVTGFLFVYLKRSLFVFTNHRIFHVPTTPNYKFKQSLSQIYYAGCQSLELKGGTLVVQYTKSGKIEKFRAFALSERKKIRALLKQRSFSGTKSQVGERFHLCPQCTRLLAVAKYVCGSCGLKFKNKIVAYILAILLPGGGYFYTRHYLLGLLNAIVEIFLLLYIAVTAQDVLNKVEGSMVYLLMLSAIFVAVKIISVIHSTHFIEEFIPRKKEIQANPAAARPRPQNENQNA
jgi:phage shock protein PspC (stress-responsive transcriptional regulator)